MKQKDSEYKKSFLVGHIDCKNRKEKSNLLVKCFLNSFRKKTPISARNVPKIPEMSLFEPREKSHRKMCTPVDQIDHKNVKNMEKIV